MSFSVNTSSFVITRDTFDKQCRVIKISKKIRLVTLAKLGASFLESDSQYYLSSMLVPTSYPYTSSSSLPSKATKLFHQFHESETFPHEVQEWDLEKKGV